MSAVHLCIDVQGKYPNANAHCTYWSQDMQSNITNLVDELKARGVPTIYVIYDKCFWNEVAEFSKISNRNLQTLVSWPLLNVDLALSYSDIIAFKSTHSACKEKAIAEYINNMGVSHLIISGIAEDHFPDGQMNPRCCVTQTAIDFREKGYAVSIAAEATELGVYEQKELIGHLSLEQRRNNLKRFDVSVRPINSLLKNAQI